MPSLRERTEIPGPRLFLVDDDREFCADLVAVLGRKFNIFQAHSGSGVLDMLDQVGPDVVLLEVDFGEDHMSGLEILERIRARQNPPPVIMLSGSQSLSVVVRAMKMGPSTTSPNRLISTTFSTLSIRPWPPASADGRSRLTATSWAA